MGFQYRIECPEPAEVRGDLLGLWQRNLPLRPEIADEKYRWTFLDSEVGRSGVYVLKAGSSGETPRIVGSVGVAVRGFWRDGRLVQAGLVSDLGVDKDHRTVLPAIRLVRQVREAIQQRFDFAYGYPNRAAEGVLLHCAFGRLGTMNRYAAVLRYGGYFDRLIKAPLLTAAAGAVLDGVGRLRRAVRRPSSLQRYRLEWLGEVDDRFDHLWRAARDEYPLVGEREARFLRWRFQRHPAERFEFAALTEGERGPVRAYAVVHRSRDVAHLRDLFGHHEALGPLLDLLSSALRAQRLACVSFDYLGSKRVVDLLLEHGFTQRPARRAVVICPGGLAMNDPRRAAGNVLLDEGRWHLTDADEDF